MSADELERQMAFIRMARANLEMALQMSQATDGSRLVQEDLADSFGAATAALMRLQDEWSEAVKI